MAISFVRLSFVAALCVYTNTAVARTMPFKGKELLVKSEQKVSSKDAKKLCAEARTAEGAALLTGDIKLRRTAGGLVCRMVCSNGTPMLFELNQTGLLPTLPALWKCPSALPALLIPHEASRFLINGADLLLPGVRGCDPSIPALEAGAAACVRVFGNPAALAIGVLAVSGATIADAVSRPGHVKGVALVVEHVVGDAMWKHADRPLPNAGFTADAAGASVSVAPLPGALADAPTITPIDVSEGTAPSSQAQAGQDGDEPHGGQHRRSPSKGRHAEGNSFLKLNPN